MNISEEQLGNGFPSPSEPTKDDGDMTRLVLQHCVMPAYQFIIQVQPDQATVIDAYQNVVLAVSQQEERQKCFPTQVQPPWSSSLFLANLSDHCMHYQLINDPVLNGLRKDNGIFKQM